MSWISSQMSSIFASHLVFMPVQIDFSFKFTFRNCGLFFSFHLSLVSVMRLEKMRTMLALFGLRTFQNIWLHLKTLLK